MAKKLLYESPCIQQVKVKTESEFCAASIMDEETKDFKSIGHETGETIDASGWTEEEWN